MGEEMSEEEKKEKGFHVKDRRRFDQGGEPREKEKESEQGDAGTGAADKPAAAETTDAKAPPQEKETETDRPADLPEINFSTFVISLSSSVMIHLGMAPDPMSGETRRELALAKQTIDILGMLKEKTKGNLSKEEEQLFQSLLSDLRLRYVDEKKKG